MLNLNNIKPLQSAEDKAASTDVEFGEGKPIIGNKKEKELKKTVRTLSVQVVCLSIAALLLLSAFVTGLVAVLSIDVNACEVSFNQNQTAYLLEYTLSYCGQAGNYCEVIVDYKLDGGKKLEKCDNDTRYAGLGYQGQYTYLEDYQSARSTSNPT